MAYFFELSKYFLISAIAGFSIPFIASLIFKISEWKPACILLFSLATVGACAGIAGGMSRVAAVGEVIPAFLGLLGAIVIYIFGSDKLDGKSRGIIVSLGVTSLSLSLFIGYISGAKYRSVPEDHRDLRAYCVRAYTDAKLLGNDVAFDKFYHKMGGWCDDAMNWHLTNNCDKSCSPPGAQFNTRSRAEIQ